MNQEHPSDDELLKKLGLTATELHDLHAKHTAYVNSLNPAQKKIVAQSMPNPSEAAATFGPGVTAERLEKFMRRHSDHAGSVTLFNEGNVHPHH